LEGALRLEDALIGEAQRLLTAYLAKEIAASDLINDSLRLFDGPAQREAQRLAGAALREEPARS
jgi:hypothetical protein